MQNSSQALKEMERKLKIVLPTLPLLAGNEMVNFSKERFRFGNWRGTSIVPWKQRAAKAKRNKGRALLVDTGRLKRSIRITKRNNSTVAVGTDVPYAKAHNEGFKGTVNVKAHTRKKYGKQHVATGKFTSKGKERMKTVQTIKGSSQVKAHSRKVNMAKRQFLGHSPWLTKKLTVTITKAILKALK